MRQEEREPGIRRQGDVEGLVDGRVEVERFSSFGGG